MFMNEWMNGWMKGSRGILESSGAEKSSHGSQNECSHILAYWWRSRERVRCLGPLTAERCRGGPCLWSQRSLQGHGAALHLLKLLRCLSSFFLWVTPRPPKPDARPPLSPHFLYNYNTSSSILPAAKSCFHPLLLCPFKALPCSLSLTSFRPLFTLTPL